jgi:hypothetical protein
VSLVGSKAGKLVALAASFLGLSAAAQEVPAPLPPLWVGAAGDCGRIDTAAFVSRCWPVTVDGRFLADDAITTWLVPNGPDGPSGTHVTGARERMATAPNRIWRGSLKGDPYGTAVFVRGPKTVVGRVTHSDGRVYRLRSLDGRTVLEQINVTAIPDGLPPRDVTPSADRAVAPRLSSCAGSPEAIRVFIALTDQAVAALGAGEFQQWVDLFVSDTNHALAVSGAKASIVLANVATTKYSEMDLGVDIAALAKGDGELWHIREARRMAGADLLLLLTEYHEKSGPTGQANNYWLTPPAEFAPLALAVVTAHGASAWFTFTHELGHLFGAGHDRPPGSKQCLGAYCSSHGHVQPKACDPHGPWMTVMANKGSCENCARRLGWSHPGDDQYGDPFGNVESENNAGTITETAPTIAQLHCFLGP